MLQKILMIRFKKWGFPLFLLAVCILSFGLLIPKLGLYWDDWETIQVLKLYGIDRIWDYFRGDRPLSGWTYALFAPFVGTSVLGWQIISLLLRYASGLAMWWLLNLIWPKHNRWNALVATLFCVYPIFRQQSIAVSYHQHWLGFLLILLSMCFMLLAVHKPERKWLLIPTSLLTQALHLAIFEYFIGLEFLRPVLLFLVNKNTHQPAKKRFWQTLKNWAPYLMLDMAFIIWRAFFAESIEGVNETILLKQIIDSPLSGLVALIKLVLQDMVFFFYSVWQDLFDLSILDNLVFSKILFLFAGITAGILVLIYFNRLEDPENETKENDNNAPIWLESIPVGLIAILLGSLPIWITGRRASMEGMFTDRFGLAATFGAALLLTGILYWISRNFKRATLITALIVMLSVNFHLATANNYRWYWIKQERVYWQLFWRAPAVEPETVFIAEYPLLTFVYPTFAFNTLYQEGDSPEKTAYFFRYLSEVNFYNSDGLIEGREIKSSFRYFQFSANILDNVFLYYQPDETDSLCLWILQPDDVDNPYISEELEDALLAATLSQILPEANIEQPAAEIFGSEPTHNWCYFYQKVELARQYKEWEKAASLVEQIESAGFEPGQGESKSPQEWLGVIDTYAHVGQWEKAITLTDKSMAYDPNYQAALCSLWERINQDINSEGSLLNSQMAINQLNCP